MDPGECGDCCNAPATRLLRVRTRGSSTYCAYCTVSYSCAVDQGDTDTPAGFVVTELSEQEEGRKQCQQAKVISRSNSACIVVSNAKPAQQHVCARNSIHAQ